jgi:hypothetical protein
MTPGLGNMHYSSVMGANIRRQIINTNINTGTSCNSDKASQFMTPAKNSAAFTSSATSRFDLILVHCLCFHQS